MFCGADKCIKLLSMKHYSPDREIRYGKQHDKIEQVLDFVTKFHQLPNRPSIYQVWPCITAYQGRENLVRNYLYLPLVSGKVIRSPRLLTPIVVESSQFGVKSEIRNKSFKMLVD